MTHSAETESESDALHTGQDDPGCMGRYNVT